MEEIQLCQPINRQAKCKFDGCYKCPTYNYKGEKKRLYCFTHKLSEMIDIKNITCCFNNCNTLPVYNYKDEKKGIYCKKHKLDNMINIKDKTCVYNECRTIPIYNYENEKFGLYCKQHKLDEMINVKNKVFCEYNDCYISPNYNYKYEKKPKFCVSHKLKNMVDVKNITCNFINCNKLASYNYKNEGKPILCAIHKLDNMMCIKFKRCDNSWCENKANKKYDNHCLRCFIHLFPDKPVTRNYKTKESSIATFVTENFPNFTWNLDKTIQDGCSRRRPDLMCDLGYQVIIVEVDENQHNKYDCSCENKRIMELSQDVGHRPIVFIRFNPDDYIDATNKNITSCWGLTPKTGLLKIRDKKQNEWNNRLNILKQQIEYWCNEENKTEKTIQIIQLFYDEIVNENIDNDSLVE